MYLTLIDQIPLQNRVWRGFVSTAQKLLEKNYEIYSYQNTHLPLNKLYFNIRETSTQLTDVNLI